MCALIRYESERILHRISFCIKFTGHRFELYKLIKCAVKLLFFIIIDAYVYRTVVDCCCWKIPSPDSDSSKSIRETMNNSMVRKCASSAHTENETHWETKTHTERHALITNSGKKHCDDQFVITLLIYKVLHTFVDLLPTFFFSMIIRFCFYFYFFL